MEVPFTNTVKFQVCNNVSINLSFTKDSPLVRHTISAQIMC